MIRIILLQSSDQKNRQKQCIVDKDDANKKRWHCTMHLLQCW